MRRETRRFEPKRAKDGQRRTTPRETIRDPGRTRERGGRDEEDEDVEGCTRTGTDVGDELVDGLGREELAEEHAPVRLHGDARGLDDGIHLVRGDFLTVVGQDERGVGEREVTGHFLSV